MVLQRKLRPPIARVNVQLDPWHAASKHTTAPINHTRPSPCKHSPDVATRARKLGKIAAYYSFIDLWKDERLSWPGWLVTYRNKVPPPGVEPGHVTHPSTNRARRRVTSLIRPTPLPLRHAANDVFGTSELGDVFKFWEIIDNSSEMDKRCKNKHSCNETLIGNRMWPIEWHHCECFWMTLRVTCWWSWATGESLG